MFTRKIDFSACHDFHVMVGADKGPWMELSIIKDNKGFDMEI